VAASGGAAATGTTARGTPSPEAAAAYADAQSAFHFGDFASATRSLKRAVAIDPAFPAANVRLALMGSATLTEGRGYYATALRSLDRLEARDQQLLRLEEPWLMDPPNVEMLTARARDMIRAWPSDPEVQYWCGHRLGITSGEVDESLSALDRALALDPSFVVAAMTRARVQLEAGDPEAAIRSSDRCLAVSAAAARCIGFKAAAHGALGQCDLAEQDLRARMTLEPREGARYRELAVVLAAKAAPVEALRETLRRAKELEPDDVGGSAAGEVLLAVYTGDFDAAEAKLSALDEATPTGADEGEHDIRALLQLYEERGEPAKAVALASSFMKRWPAWTHNDPGGSRPMVAAILHRAGQIADEPFRAQRSAWLDERASVDGRAFPASVVHWMEFYADPARGRGCRGARVWPHATAI
jgi:tetratricopeptide (TPR) repeat protein